MKQESKPVETSLWECLHDGELEVLSHDALRRSVLMVWDVPFLWDFHSLSEQTRFMIELAGVQELQVFECESWPGSETPSKGLPWEEQQAILEANSRKATYTSRDWPSFTEGLRAMQNRCSAALLHETNSNLFSLSVDLANDTLHEYRTVRFIFEKSRFAITPNRTLSLVDFLAMGQAYWDAFTARSKELKGK